MKSLEKKVKEQDAYIKSQAKKLKDAIDRTVSLDGVEDKIESKLIKFLQKEVTKKGKKIVRNDEGALRDGASGIF